MILGLLGMDSDFFGAQTKLVPPLWHLGWRWDDYDFQWISALHSVYFGLKNVSCSRLFVGVFFWRFFGLIWLSGI